VVVNNDENYLKSLIPQINDFLDGHLKLSLHPRKIKIKKFNRGIDFLGYTVLPYHRLLRTKTKRRMYKRIETKYNQYEMSKLPGKSFEQSFQSYYGLLKHCNAYGMKEKLKKLMKDI
jgi:ssDNA-specific exonuclease RecJ